MSRHRHRVLIAPSLAVCLLLSACTPSVDEEDWFGTAAGDDTPIKDRQYIDDYATYVVPAILEFLDELSNAGVGEWNNGEEPPWGVIHRACKGGGLGESSIGASAAL